MPGFDAKSHANALQTQSCDNTVPADIEDSQLFLPSELSRHNRRKYCATGLADLEDRLRHAEATDALEDLRHHLRTRSFTNHFKIANVTGQINNTRSKGIQHRIDDKVHHSQLHFNRARTTLFALRGQGEWEKVLQVLEKSDVRALNERQITEQEKDDILRVRMRGGRNTDNLDDERAIATVAAVGEGQRRPSWIWYSGNSHENIDDSVTRIGMLYSQSSTMDSTDSLIALRVEWAKAKARADRWGEEVVLLDEEMRRTLEFCSWKAAWWESRITQRVPSDGPLADGLRAYAYKQAALEREISDKWALKWRGTRNQAIPVISAVMGEDWLTPSDGQEDDFVHDLIELELDDQYEGDAVGSDCED